MSDFQDRFAALVKSGKLLSEARAIALNECGIVRPAPKSVRIDAAEWERDRLRRKARYRLLRKAQPTPKAR